jgi:hypothetical protein
VRVVVEIPVDDENGPWAVKLLMDALICIWGRYLSRHQFPKLYSCRIRYQQEPNAGQYEVWKSPAQTFEDGWGDCDDLVLWRAAELVAAGERASCQTIARRNAAGVRMHVRVRRQSGKEEDPSLEVEKFK